MPASEKPLLGAVLCCTSIPAEDRTRLAEYAEYMGAEHKLDLTSDVTHLLVGSTDTPKYQYVAREREDVKVLRPEWVEAVRKRWMEDQQLDMNALEAEYRIPTFAGLKICITGFDDLTFRGLLQKNVVENGGQYTGDLTKDVTHLIAAKPEGKKYEYASLWEKKVVSLQWYKDTLERGMQLDESKYHPTRLPEQQGIGAWNRQEKQQSKIGKRTRDDLPMQEPTRKLRRTASTKLTSQTDDMWGDIVGQTSQQARSNGDVLRTTKSMPSMRDEKFQEPVADREEPQLDHHRIALDNRLGFLNGTIFAVTKFEARQEALVSRTLQAAGATVLDSYLDLIAHETAKLDNTFLIVPYQTRHKDLPSLRKFDIQPAVVTELWLERCMLHKALIPPAHYPLGGVISEISTPDISNFTVNATGFQSIETLHIAKTVALTGAKYTEVFTPRSSVLVYNSMNENKQKTFHARQWGVPVVTESWLCKFLTSGSIPNLGPNELEGQEDENNDLEAEMIEKRKTRRPQPPADNDETSDTEDGPSISRNIRSNTSTFTDKVAESKTTNNHEKKENSTNQGQSRGQQHSQKSRGRGATALQEISPNSPTRKDRSAIPPPKKSLFQTFDGADTAAENLNSVPNPSASDLFVKPASPTRVTQDAASINSAIDDLLNMKAKAKANASAQRTGRQDKKGKLLSRALSNLSNASHGSRHSRASSIDSLNTDGVGSEIAPPSGRSVGAEGFGTGLRRASNQARTYGRMSPAVNLEMSNSNAPMDISDPNFLRDEYATEETAPQPTQLGYEDSEEAIALRERLAEKRRARTRLGQKEGDPAPEITAKEREAAMKQKQKEKRVIKDDDLFTATGWGGGRRTRAKNRSADLNDLDMF